MGVARLRENLTKWKLNQLLGKTGGPNWLLELENSYKKIFLGRFFDGLEPMYTSGAPAPEEYYFILNDGNRTYDIEEMSAGEQAVFPLLFEFVRMQIRNSVVLIDEIDLNLHPPLAQALLASLSSIGPECQFFLTTHSEAISEVFSGEDIYRLEGGRLCPVTILLCEGGPNSPDVRVLLTLLNGLCRVRPMGGKYGMGERILALREASGGKETVCGILDGDFVSEWSGTGDEPQKWEVSRVSGRVSLGWRWARKEIENYLIDPSVVEKTVRDIVDHSAYHEALHDAKDRIALYQAARMALSDCRIRFQPLPNSFGNTRGIEKHTFPDLFDEESCIQGIETAVREHHTSQTIDCHRVKELYQKYKSECIPNGIRNQHFLHAFAGKDLLWAMNDWLSHNRLIGALAFREKILTGIRATQADIASWIPEWNELKKTIQFYF